MFSFLVATIVSMSGTWILPVKDTPTNLVIVQRDTKVAAILEISHSSRKPASLPLFGAVGSAKCGTFVELYSDRVELSKKCHMIVGVAGCGILGKNTFDANSVVVVGVFCKGQDPRISTDRIPGIWIKKIKGTSI